MNEPKYGDIGCVLTDPKSYVGKRKLATDLRKTMTNIAELPDEVVTDMFIRKIGKMSEEELRALGRKLVSNEYKKEFGAFLKDAIQKRLLKG